MASDTLTPPERAAIRALLDPTEPDDRSIDEAVLQSLLAKGFVRLDAGGYAVTLPGHARYLASFAERFPD